MIRLNNRKFTSIACFILKLDHAGIHLSCTVLSDCPVPCRSVCYRKVAPETLADLRLVMLLLLREVGVLILGGLRLSFV